MNDLNSERDYGSEYLPYRNNVTTLNTVIIGGITYRLQQDIDVRRYLVNRTTIFNNIINYEEKQFSTYEEAQDYLNTVRIEALLNSK